MDEFERMLVGNSSAKEDNTEESIVSSCHIVESNDLEEQSYIDKDGYQKYLKNYTAKILKHLEEKRPDDAEQFKANVGKAMKRILSSFDDWRFFSGRTDSLDLDGMLAIMGYHSDQKTPYMLFFRDGLYKEEMVKFHLLVTVHFLSVTSIVSGEDQVCI